MIRYAVILQLGLVLSAAGAESPHGPETGGPWWEVFDHPGLSVVIEQGLEANADPVAAAARLLEARQQVSAAAASGRPVAALDAAYRLGREKSLMTGGVEDDIDPWAASARVSWELDVFGRVAGMVDAASARADVRQSDIDAVRLALSTDIARTYIDLSFRHEQITLLQASADDARAVLDRAVRRRDAGLENPVVAEDARAAYQQAEHRLMEAEIERDQRMAGLREQLGGEDPQVMPGPLASFQLPPAPDLTRTNLYLARPDVTRAHHLWRAAEGDAVSSARDRLPSLSLVVAAAGEGEDTGDPEQWEAWAGPVLSIPLWEPRRGAEARSARAGVTAAEAEFLSVSRRAVKEIDAAWIARQHAAAMTAHMEDRYNALAAAATTAERKREAGLIQESDLRSVRMTAREAAIARDRWHAAGLTSHINLMGAMGGGSTRRLPDP